MLRYITPTIASSTPTTTNNTNTGTTHLGRTAGQLTTATRVVRGSHSVASAWSRGQLLRSVRLARFRASPNALRRSNHPRGDEIDSHPARGWHAHRWERRHPSALAVVPSH